MAATFRALRGDDGKGQADLRDSLGIGPRDRIHDAIDARIAAAIAKAEGGGA